MRVPEPSTVLETGKFPKPFTPYNSFLSSVGAAKSPYFIPRLLQLQVDTGITHAQAIQKKFLFLRLWHKSNRGLIVIKNVGEHANRTVYSVDVGRRCFSKLRNLDYSTHD
jgi:hypothetical protein